MVLISQLLLPNGATVRDQMVSAQLKCSLVDANVASFQLFIPTERSISRKPPVLAKTPDNRPRGMLTNTPQIFPLFSQDKLSDRPKRQAAGWIAMGEATWALAEVSAVQGEVTSAKAHVDSPIAIQTAACL